MSAATTPKAKRLQSSRSLGRSTAPNAASGLLDVFPQWTDQLVTEKELPGKYEDPLGMMLPPAVEPFCDAWKRAEELLYGAPNVPMICVKSAADMEKKSRGGAPVSRELDGKVYAGHETFEWLQAVISYIMSAQKHMKKGEYLWELIYPKEKDGTLPARSPSGRYRVKLFILDTWRAVTVDDRIPVDLFGHALLVGSRPLQLWPLLLCKAVLKVMAVFRVLDKTLPHQVAAFQMLTGWPQEDLLDPLSGTALAGGQLFNRLEEMLGGPMAPPQDLCGIVSCCLLKRSKPQRAPPRLLVLTGPSGVGRSQLIARLVSEFPDKFGVTISHTSRLPREHEVDGRDYYFTDKHKLLADVRAKRFLEAARVTVHSRPCNSSAAAAAAAPAKPVSWWYGTSLATVREVAATGKLCLMSLDVQGATALHSNQHIDGLYLYINTATPTLLAARQKARLAEAPSTLAKRVAWAKQQMAKSTAPGLFDAVIPNTGLKEVYAALKDVISTLSPIIRNRLRGLPAYVLDYSDLIPPNSVEKPFLKPVLLAGPDVGERRHLLEMLAEEFPDVFAFPCQHTTQPPGVLCHHLGIDGDELQLLTDKPGSTPRSNTAAAEPTTADHATSNSTPKQEEVIRGSSVAVSSTGSGGVAQGSCSINSNKSSHLLGPAPVVMSKEDFDAAASNGKFLEAHTDLFMHPLVAHRHAHSLEHVRQVIKSGKLPLMALEAEGAESLKSKGINCLTVFLAPPSVEAFEERLKDWATETDKEVAERQELAAAQLAAVTATGVFDQVIVNDKLDEGYSQLKAAIGKFRPDLIPPAEDESAAQAAKKAAVNQPVLLVLLGPVGGGSEQLAQQLLQRFPQHFGVPRKLTDRKPGKGEKDLPDVEYCKPDALAKLVALGQVVWSRQDASGATQAVTADALNDIAAAGKMVLLELGAASVEQLKTVKEHPAMQGAFVAIVCRGALFKASLAAAGVTEQAAAQQVQQATAQMQDLQTGKHVQACISSDDPEEAFAQLQEPLWLACPWAMLPLLQPLVVSGPFGSGKRAVLQRLIKALPDVIGVPRVVTSKPRPLGAAAAEDMEVVTMEVAEQMKAQGMFLIEQTVLGHTYGITSASVRKLQACGKLPLLNLDKVSDVARLKASGFQATYIYLQPPSLEQLQQRIMTDIMTNPPLHHEPADAAKAAAAQAVQEAAAAAAHVDLFDVMLVHDPQDINSTVGKMSEVLHQHYPQAVPSSCVWGYGRPLWDASCRLHGYKPLRIILLGPAASGKSTLSARLSAKFGLPHINAGDLLYAEVAARSEIGLEAKQYMDGSKTVPAWMLLTLLLRRLAAPDCAAQGWVLDGFPHTGQQSQVLSEAGHVPDKVIMLEGPHSLLLDRVKYRRIDYNTGKVYHMAEAGALSEPVRPARPDGSLDTEVLACLAVRHDDSPENVTKRLALWDRQVHGLLAAYEDVTLRLAAAGNPDYVSSRAETFVKLEAEAGTAGSLDSTAMAAPTASWQLEDLTYRVVATIRYQRQQLVQLQQLDGKLVWVKLQELCGNSSCLLLAHNPATLPVLKSIKRLDRNTVATRQLLAVESAEPFNLLVSLAMGPQHAALPPPAFQKKVFVLAGPTGAGRRTLATRLLKDLPEKLMAAALLTNRPPHKLEVFSSCCRNSSAKSDPDMRISHAVQVAPAAACLGANSNNSMAGTRPYTSDMSGLLQFVPDQQFKVLQHSHQLAGLCQHLDHAYAVSAAQLEAAAAQGKAALVIGPLQLADQLRHQLTDTQVNCIYLQVDTESLDVRLRQGSVEEAHLQQLLQDAQMQEQHLQQLLQQQREHARLEDMHHPHAADVSQAGGSPPVAALSGAPAAARAAASGASPAAAAASAAAGKPTTAPQAAAAAAAAAHAATAVTTASQLQLSAQQRVTWLSAVANPAGQLQNCYSWIKAVLCKHWPVQQQCMPGLLLMQRCVGLDRHKINASTADSTLRQQQQQQLVNSSSSSAGACLDDDVFSQSHTLLQIKSTTASAAMMQLPRGKHLLQLQCSPLLLHCVSLYAADDFVVDEAARLLPALQGLHVTEEEGDQEALTAGTRHLLFRYMLRPSQPCTASFELRTSSSALQACSTLLLVDNSTRQAVSHILNAPSQVPLAATDKGYTLLALAEPHVDVPSSSWTVTVTSSQALQPLQSIPAVKQVLLEGDYVANAQAMVARYVIAPTTAVQVALLSQLSTGHHTPQDHQPAATCPLSYSLQLFDTSGAKEVAWGASYKLLADAEAGSNGRAALASVQLAPGRYLLVLQLLPQHSKQWVDSVTGSTEPAPHWQLLCLPSADEKVCPIVRDDSYERHFKSTIEGWQQQAAARSGGSGSRPPTSGSGGRPTASRDRPRMAQAALDRYIAAEQQAKDTAITSASAIQVAAIPSNANARGAVADTPSSGAGAVQLEGAGHAGSSLQVTPRAAGGSVQQQQPSSSRLAAVMTRQLKGAEVLQLAPMEQVKHVVASHSEAVQVQAGLAPAVELKQRLQQEAADQGALLLAALASRQLPAIGALQAQQAIDFAQYRAKTLAECEEAASQRQELLRALLPASTKPSDAAAAGQAAAAAAAGHQAAAAAAAHRHNEKASRR